MKRKVSQFVAQNISRTRDDFIVEYKRGSGKGGQNRNVRDTAVKITDKITGLTADICDERSQKQNKDRAFAILVDRLIAHYTSLETREPVVNEEIRVYKEHLDTVKDHRTGVRQSFKKTLNGELDVFQPTRYNR